MIEIFRNTSDHVTHTAYFSGSPVEVDLDQVDVVIQNPETGETWTPEPAESLNLGRYRIQVPYAATQYDATLRSFWKYHVDGQEVNAEETIQVVTPYVSIEEIISEYPQLQGKTYEELRSMERRVRLMINHITGQEFGTKKKVETGTLNADGTYRLSERAYHVHYFTVNGVAHSLADLQLLNDGWTVQVTFTEGGWYHVKSDVFYGRREPKMSVVLHGTFGWPVVPNDINMAAKMLIGDYFCSDAVYRQRGVQAVRAADWRLDFHDKAFEGTGNLDVDILLSKYAAFNMVVI